MARGAREVEKRKHLSPLGDKETITTPFAAHTLQHLTATMAGLDWDPAAATGLDLTQMSEPGPSTGFRPPQSLSPLPQGRDAGKSGRPPPEATFTLTTAGICQSGDCEADMPLMVQKWISEVVQRGFEAGIRHNRHPVSIIPEVPVHGRYQPFQGPRDLESYQDPCSSASSIRSDDSISMEEGQIDQELSEEEGLIPDQPVFKGLFRPHLFKALLFKSKSSTSLGTNSTRPDNSTGEQDPTELLFSESMMEAEPIPAPQLFMDMIQHQWASPGAYTNPT